MIDLLLIACVLVFIIDLSGVITELETFMQKKLKRKVVIRKPWSCSLCMVWWSGLVYLLVTQSFTIPMVAYVGLLAYFTPVISDFMIICRELIIKVLNRLC